MAAVRDRRGPPRRLAVGAGRARDPHRHERAGRVRADHAAGRGDPVQLALPAAVARPRHALVRSARRDRRHEPRPAAAGLSRVARDPLARVRELAGGGAARARYRQRRQAVVDAGADGGLHHGRADSGVATDRSRGLGPRRSARAGDSARGDHSNWADDLHARGSATARLGEARRDAGFVARRRCGRSQFALVPGEQRRLWRWGKLRRGGELHQRSVHREPLRQRARERRAGRRGGRPLDERERPGPGAVAGQDRRPANRRRALDDRESGRPRARRGPVGPPGDRSTSSAAHSSRPASRTARARWSTCGPCCRSTTRATSSRARCLALRGSGNR